jgi:hypothetical protein
MRITVLKRGGLSVYGGTYDAQTNTARTDTDQQQTVELIFPETITALALTENGIDAGSVTISTTKATFTISGSGSLECIATMGSERPKVTLQAETQGTTDYGTA